MKYAEMPFGFNSEVDFISRVNEYIQKLKEDVNSNAFG